ncbi:MAG TPA: BamA/TamA family outer membrane protein [Steroidobacteraceae bacterium]|nr:BamA/TamA family outer membrane protein [Steroidobacteraceae bacterium]
MPRATILAAWLLAAAAWPAIAAEPAIEIDIEGIEGAPYDNVVALLSLKRLQRSPDLDDEMVGRLAQRAPGEVRAALRPFGYYEPQVDSEVARHEGGWRVRIRVEPGPPVVLVEQQVEITGSGQEEPFLRDALARSSLRTGERLSHAAYDQLKGELLRAAAGNGYLDAGFTRSELLVDPSAREARAHITLDTGDRYRFGSTTIEQDLLRPDLVARYLRYREGDWYDATALLRTQFALDDSQYFAVVEVLPGQRDRERRIAPIRISSEPNRRHLWTAAVGYATDTRARGTLGFEDRRMNSRGHRLRLELRGSSPEEAVRIAWVMPWTDPALEKLALELRGFREQRADVDTAGASLRAGLTQVRGNWQRVVSLTADATRDQTTAVVDDVATVTRTKSRLLVPGISFALLPPGFLGADAVPRGFQAELLGSTAALGSDTDFARLVVRDERRFGFAPRWHLQLRAEAGASAVGEFQQLPAQYRFFAGGDRSVRGFGYEELSPVDADGNRVGGRYLLTGSVELQRDLPRNFVAALFADAGNAIDDFGDPLEYAVGIGLRYRLPFLSIGIDVAQPLSERGRGPRLHLNFSPEL